MSDPDCRKARQLLDDIRRNRRSQRHQDLAAAAEVLGYRIDKRRGKGSHWYARGGPGDHFPIPTNRDPVSVGVTTAILRILEEAYDDVCGR